jgi:hypothetical protein
LFLGDALVVVRDARSAILRIPGKRQWIVARAGSFHFLLPPFPSSFPPSSLPSPPVIVRANVREICAETNDRFCRGINCSPVLPSQLSQSGSLRDTAYTCIRACTCVHATLKERRERASPMANANRCACGIVAATNLITTAEHADKLRAERSV